MFSLFLDSMKTPLKFHFDLKSPEDPEDYEEELETAQPEPIALESKKGKKRKASKDKANPKAAKPGRPPAGPLRGNGGSLEIDAILNSFLEAYRPVIRALPTCLWPSSDKHGEHSYTVYLAIC